MTASVAIDRLHFVIEETPLWCVPTRAGLFTPPVDPTFDRNRCATLHAGEAVRALLAHPQQPWVYVHAGHTVGWVFAAPLTPSVDVTSLESYRHADRRVAVVLDRADVTAPTVLEPAAGSPVRRAPLRLGTTLPLLDADPRGYRVLVADERGLAPARLPRSDALRVGPLPFRPSDVIRTALDHVGQRYGWGGHGGDYDCSLFLRDLFAVFGVQLARHSAVQAQLGSRSRDIGALDEAGKRAAIREAAQRGVVLLYMPGHIMLYLGEDGDRMYAVSAISEYLEPCESGPDTVRRLDRVAVTTLELGRSTQRKAFIERLTRIASFGHVPVP
ncbi:MAG: hypothetical protein B7733_18070 [Myxococcales bacterium FL481]|nr:MAG: hypothetical protein B7733_18070 [Myxococcales bacterium FL481]